MSEVHLPQGWCTSKISDISIKGEQRKPSGAEAFIYVDIGSINRDLKCIESPQRLIGKDAPSRARKVISTGDVLVSLTRPNLNAVALVPSELDNQISSTGFEVIKPLLVDSRYIFSLTRSKNFIDSISGAVQGALYPAAKSSDVQAYTFPLPPLAEQKAIADKLDIMLTQVEATKVRLKRIPEILKAFRQSVLAAAVSGKLTEEWRVTNAKVFGEIKPLAFAGKVIAGQSPSKSEVNSEGKGEPYVTGPEQWDGRKILHHKWTEHPKRMAPERSIFVTVKGAGVGTTFPGCYAAIGRDVYAFVPNENMNYTYILFAIQASAKDVVLKAKGLIPGLTKSDIVDHEVYLPSINEQTEIVHRVEELFAYSDSIEQKTNSALARVNNLTQSILAKAFRGELTTDWRAIHPDLISGENSAEALLKKIKIERETIKKQPRSRIVKKKKESSTNMANKLISVLEETGDWIAAQEAFRLCGVADGTPTERIEELYSELRDLDKAGRLKIDPVTDEQGRKLYDRLKLVGV
ncbi:restriction endonuclease subunit S [Kluyvera sp. CRP]|uniref:restriction endonuclease subunit S n=1 Tax=Kluyvera sp. CRP TaxID=2873269 RepID=UPI001CC21E03|nr:restriction endonuclease subunit S [Kluyvera sp. CRP]UAK20348.1 restriction endonuclease subunit S [Kluyvera sp. CRP]